MDNFTSMSRKLKSTKIYSVVRGGRNYAELKAYTAGLEMLTYELDAMLREYYIDTSLGYGITEKERFMGAVREDLNLLERKELLKIREQTNERFCTPEAFNKILSGYGLKSYEIVENCSQNSLTINIGDKLDEKSKAWVERMIENDFPAHLEINVKYI